MGNGHPPAPEQNTDSLGFGCMNKDKSAWRAAARTAGTTLVKWAIATLNAAAKEQLDTRTRHDPAPAPTKEEAPAPAHGRGMDHPVAPAA